MSRHAIHLSTTADGDPNRLLSSETAFLFSHGCYRLWNQVLKRSVVALSNQLFAACKRHPE